MKLGSDLQDLKNREMGPGPIFGPIFPGPIFPKLWIEHQKLELVPVGPSLLNEKRISYRIIIYK